MFGSSLKTGVAQLQLLAVLDSDAVLAFLPPRFVEQLLSPLHIEGDGLGEVVAVSVLDGELDQGTGGTARSSRVP